MLWVGLMQARDDYISQTNIGPVYCYQIHGPEHIGNT